MRCLVENVVVTISEPGDQLLAKIHWKGGEVTPIQVRKNRPGGHDCVTDPDLVDLVRKLAGEFSDDQIARILSRKRLRTATGLPFTPLRVNRLRLTHGIAGTKRAKLADKDVYTAAQAAELLGVSHPTVLQWLATGLLRGSQVVPGAPWRVQVTEEDRRRLSPTDAPEGWLPLISAARALGVSQPTVLKKLKSGQLEGVRVRNGARTAWRIRIPSTTYDTGSTLFD